MRRPEQSERWRVAVFVAVVGLHCLTGFIVVASRTIRIARLPAETPPSLLILAQQIPQQVTAPSPASIHNFKSPHTQPDVSQRPNIAEPEPNNAITVAFDLSTDADGAAKRQADPEQDEKRWRDLAGASESQLEWWKNNAPLEPDHHLPGDSEHAAGGELITWVNDRCFYTTHGIATFGLPETTKVCKDPPKSETELFKDMRKKLDESVKGRAP